MNITEKITKDINQFKTAPQTFNTPGTSSWDLGLSGINTTYVLFIVLGIVAIFVAWFAWDWYKHQKMLEKKKEEDEERPPSRPSSPPPPKETSTQNVPEIVTTMSPLMYAKYKNDQCALENALDPEPIPRTQDYVVEDSTTSAIQSKLTSKPGWCYIGEDQGYGSCVKVDGDQFCMSGHVYPSESMCRQVPKTGSGGK